MSIEPAAIRLFLVMGPLGNIPFFLSARRGVGPAHQWRPPFGSGEG